MKFSGKGDRESGINQLCCVTLQRAINGCSSSVVSGKVGNGPVNK